MVGVCRRRHLLVWAVAPTMLWSWTGQADDVVLHEFIPADPREDVELAATTPDGKLPAAIETS
ncbi:MAG: hypothetical protein MUF54_22470, partial [Polyangiaceae bacterium]|nr:hypothetical protein [Polyangiaceae bacterium]